MMTARLSSRIDQKRAVIIDRAYQEAQKALSDLQIAAAYAVFAGSYLVFAIGNFPGLKIDRPGAAIIGAVLMVAFRLVTPEDAIRSVDFATIVLLFSMMLIAATLRLAGFFDWVTEHLVARLRPSRLLPTIIFTSGLLSAFFVNDIVCLVMTPFVIDLTRRMRLPPIPHLLGLAMASNIGSVATITGNPQNMLIGSFSGIAYSDFMLRLGPVAIVGLFVNWGVLAWFGRNKSGPAAEQPMEALAAAEPGVVDLPAGSGEYRLAIRRLPHRRPLVKPVIVMIAVLAGFLAGVPPALMAAVGAAVLLITRARDPREVYDDVDWGLLVFFVGLFLIVRGAENAGVITAIMNMFSSLNLHNVAPFSFVTVVLSNVVSNVPAVMLLKSAATEFADPQTGWLMLAMASTLAGNLTITGSVANIIVVERAAPQVRIGFGEYFRVGAPITVITVLFGTLWLMWN